MKDNILDVLIYVFENFILDQDELLELNSEEISQHLSKAGFNDKNIGLALAWLLTLKEQTLQLSSNKPFSSIRYYTLDEYKKLSDATRFTLYCLERDEAITPSIRELIIDRLMALNHDQIQIEDLKWIMLMVLCFQGELPIRIKHLENVIVLENSNNHVLH